MSERKVKKTELIKKKIMTDRKNIVKKSNTKNNTITKKKPTDKKKMIHDNKKNKHPKPDLKKLISPSTAARSPVGSFHHPTKKTFRTGACPIGFI